MVNHIDETPDPSLHDERVRSLLDALAAPTEPGPLPGELDAVVAFRSQHRTRRTPMSRLNPVRAAVATALGTGVFLAAGAGAAAAGVLPAAAQDTAHEMLASLGIDVPAAERPADRSERADEVEPVDESGTAETESEGRGEEISEIAKDPALVGQDKGVAVSEAASEGKSRAGEHGAPEDGTVAGAPENPSADRGSADQGADAPVVETPNAGGTGTADTATDGSSMVGTDEADEASGGRSGAGSANSGR
jgi:hypothetical protein